MSARRVVASIAIGAALCGCGQPELWARYQAERSFWHARRVVERIQVNPALTRPADYERAIAAFRDVVDRFPLSRWATPERARDRRARDVAGIAGDAWIAIGRIEESRDRLPRALEAYREAEAGLVALPTVRLKALLAEAAVRERIGDTAVASQIYVEIARGTPPVDPESGEPIHPALEAPLRVADDLRRAGRAETADSVLASADARFTAEAARQAGRPAAPALWAAAARARASRAQAGWLDSALEALRHGLAESRVPTVRADLILTAGQFCIDGNRPDSGLVYAAWATRGSPATRRKGMLLEARIWETVSVDSAIVSYGRFMDAFPTADDAVMRARFRRAELLEQRGRWEEARAEFRGLANSSATHELALEAHERIVAHHLKAGETEMGRIEARRALENLDHLLTTVQDDETLMRIRQARARLLTAVGSWEQAYVALADLWTRYGREAVGVRAAFRAAEVAERELNDRERARRLYEELSTRSPSPIDQEMARRQLERLRHARG